MSETTHTPVVLRNNERAFVTGRSGLEPHTLQGYRVNGGPDLWTEDGAWSESGIEHPLDIVGVVTPDGQLVPFIAKKNP